MGWVEDGLCPKSGKMPPRTPSPWFSALQTCIWAVLLCLLPGLATKTSAQSAPRGTGYLECGRVPLARHRRVVGGVAVRRCAAPWIVHISRDPSSDDVCGGTLVSDRHVITAAHCFDNLENSYKPILTFNANIRVPHVWTSRDYVTSDYDVTVHPNYTKITFAYDVAVLTLSRTLPLSELDCVQPICLPESSDELPLGSRCSVAGWGSVARGSDPARASVMLRQAGVTVVEQKICRSKFNGRYQNGSQICAGDLTGATDACVGDSGGPLVCDGAIFSKFRSSASVTADLSHNRHIPKPLFGVKTAISRDRRVHYLAGVVSAGARPCAQPGTPAVYTDVTVVREWIDTVMAMPRVTPNHES